MVPDPQRQSGSDLTNTPRFLSFISQFSAAPSHQDPGRSIMPTYEYACPKCGIVEVFQSIKEAALTKCPTCKKAKVQRMVSLGGGVIFKGSGFWETDYNRSSDYQAKQKAEGPKPATTTEGATPKTDAPEPKTAPEPKAAPAPKTAPTSKPSAQTKPAPNTPKAS